MNRRAFLVSAGAAALAGCTGGGTAGDSTSTTTPSTATTTTTTSPPTTTTTAYPDPVTSTLSGTGQTVTESFTPELAGPTVFAFAYQGSSNFAVWLLDDSGSRQDLLANVIGAYSGVRMTGAAGTHYLEVDTTGPWSVEIRSLPVYETGQSLPVHGGRDYASFVGPVQFPGSARATFSASSQGNNVAWLRDAFGQKADLLFNTIGPQNEISTTVQGSGVGYVGVQSNGTWSLDLESM